MRWRRCEVEQKCSSRSWTICMRRATSWLPSMLARYPLKQRSLATSSSLVAAAQVFMRNFSSVALRVRRESAPLQWSTLKSLSCEVCCVEPIFKYIKYVISQMIKPKGSISPLRTTKKSLRPLSSTSLPRRPTPQVTNILLALEQNVRELKNHFHLPQGNNSAKWPEKSQKGFRSKRTLVRNSSQSNLNARTDKGDKSDHDIFDIRNEYLRVHGRLTNNIAELYEFYRKNQEKREKSTRILASMEFSNGGQSASPSGKESLLKHSQLLNYRHPEDQRIDEASEDSHPPEPNPTAKPKKSEKTSELASELISKGCYNIANIANLLNCKKYRLTKEKEDSFKRPQDKPCPEPPQLPSNENNMNAQNIAKGESNKKTEPHNELPRSPEIRNPPDISFKKLNGNCVGSNGKSFECSSISKQEKDIERVVFQSSMKESERADRGFLELEESPIFSKNGKEFEKSKFYVKPIPMKQGLLHDKSISLHSASKIIDIDIDAPFEI